MGAASLLRRWLGEPAERVSTREGYALWAPVYPPRPHNALMEVEESVVAPLLIAARPVRALDIGTGTGRNLRILRAAGASLAAGVDLSPAMLSQGGAGGGCVCADARRLPFLSSSVDLVSSSLMCGDVDDLSAFIGEAARVLRRGGQFVYSDFHPSWSAAGWRRTFVGSDGRPYELPYYSHRIEHHLELLAAFDLELRVVREPKIVGRASPVVVVLHAVKAAGRRR